MSRACVVAGCAEPRAKSQSRCYEHQNEYMRAWREAHPTYMREYLREYMRQRTGYYDKVVCSVTECRCAPSRAGLCHKHAPRLRPPADKSKVCTSEGCSEQKYARSSLCYDHYRQARVERDRRYRETHRERIRVYRKHYAATHPEVVTRSAQNRRARKIAALVENVDQVAVYERDGWRCQLCRRVVHRHLRHPHPGSASLDHVIPLSRGGTHEYRNVQLAHLRCNIRKNAGVLGDAEQLRLIA